MSPLKVSLNSLVWGIATSYKAVLLPNGLSVNWWEKSGRGLICGHGYENYFFGIPNINDSISVRLPVQIAPIEAGEPITEVLWTFRLTRIAKPTTLLLGKER